MILIGGFLKLKKSVKNWSVYVVENYMKMVDLMEIVHYRIHYQKP